MQIRRRGGNWSFGRAGAAPATAASKNLILATTTSTQDSGLLDVLVPLFEKKTGYSVKAKVQIGLVEETITGTIVSAVGGTSTVTLANANTTDYPTATNGTIRNVEQAVRYAERACALTTNSAARYLDTLGVAYSEAGRFNDAVQVSERGAALARAAGNRELAEQAESRIKLYESGRPYHEASAPKR